MTYLDHLPDQVARLIRTRYIAEFATLSRDGVPIDTPLVPFTSADLETIDAGTGLAYATKAERARRNPRVGMLFEGGADEPVVSIGGMAAVRDRDLQANLDRYLAEEILTPAFSPRNVDYAAITRHAIWYFTRVLVCVKPAVVRWWPNPAAMDEPPHLWRAPAGTAFPASDPAPPGAPSKAPWRPPPSWQALVEGALARKAPAHVTLIDAEGFPLPVRAREVHAHEEGLRLVMPRWLPWSAAGKATVSFEGIETLIGDARIEGAHVVLRIERAVPVMPLMADPSEILQPSPAMKQTLLDRLEYELKRRGKSWPAMPAEPPEPTPGARLRADTAFAFAGFSSADG
jgi:hypothetical protein